LVINGNVGEIIEILVKNWKCWSNMEILVINGNVGQQWKCWSKMEILVINGNLGEKLSVLLFFRGGRKKTFFNLI